MLGKQAKLEKPTLPKVHRRGFLGLVSSAAAAVAMGGVGLFHPEKALSQTATPNTLKKEKILTKQEILSLVKDMNNLSNELTNIDNLTNEQRIEKAREYGKKFRLLEENTENEATLSKLHRPMLGEFSRREIADFLLANPNATNSEKIERVEQLCRDDLKMFGISPEEFGKYSPDYLGYFCGYDKTFCPPGS